MRTKYNKLAFLEELWDGGLFVNHPWIIVFKAKKLAKTFMSVRMDGEKRLWISS